MYFLSCTDRGREAAHLLSLNRLLKICLLHELHVASSMPPLSLAQLKSSMNLRIEACSIVRFVSRLICLDLASKGV